MALTPAQLKLITHVLSKFPLLSLRLPPWRHKSCRPTAYQGVTQPSLKPLAYIRAGYFLAGPFFPVLRPVPSPAPSLPRIPALPPSLPRFYWRFNKALCGRILIKVLPLSCWREGGSTARDVSAWGDTAPNIDRVGVSAWGDTAPLTSKYRSDISLSIFLNDECS